MVMKFMCHGLYIVLHGMFTNTITPQYYYGKCPILLPWYFLVLFSKCMVSKHHGWYHHSILFCNNELYKKLFAYYKQFVKVLSCLLPSQRRNKIFSSPLFSTKNIKVHKSFVFLREFSRQNAAGLVSSVLVTMVTEPVQRE